MIRMAFYGSSLLSSYWNGAATYYRGILSALAPRGYDITFYEPDAFERQAHRDIDPPDWARVCVYPATPEAVRDAVAAAAQADIVVKASGVGVFDDELLFGTMEAAREDALRLFWDVDAPATLTDLRQDRAAALQRMLPTLDMVLTYGGGAPVVRAYTEAGARQCVPVYNALDPATHFHRLRAIRHWRLTFLSSPIGCRTARHAPIEQFFFEPAHREVAATQFPAGWRRMAGQGRIRQTSAGSVTWAPSTTTRSTSPQWPC